MNKNKKLSAIENAPSWEGVKNNGRDIFTFNLSEQSKERKEFVEGAFSKVFGEVPDKVFCLLDYDSDDAPEIYKSNPQGHYLVSVADSDIVFQVKRRINEDAYKLSDEIFSHLNECGIQTPRLIPLVGGELVGNYENYHIAAASFVEGKHLDPMNLDHVSSIGVAAAKLEGAMAILPSIFMERVIDGAGGRAALVSAGIDYALDDNNLEYIKNMVPSMDTKQFKQDLEVFKNADKAICHGDLVEMNVVIMPDNEIALLDFDDMNYLPVGLDSGMMAYRIAFDGVDVQGDVGQDVLAVNAIVDGFNSQIDDESDEIDADYLCYAMRLAVTYKAALTLGMVAQDMKSDISAESRFRVHGAKYADGVKRLDAILNQTLQNELTEELSP